MNAKEFLQTALGGNMNFGTLKPLALEEIMEQYSRHKSQETCEADVRLNNLLSAKTLLEEWCNGSHDSKIVGHAKRDGHPLNARGVLREKTREFLGT